MHFLQIFLNSRANYQLLFVKTSQRFFRASCWCVCHLSEALAQRPQCFHQGTDSFEQVPDKISDLWKLSSASLGHCRLKYWGTMWFAFTYKGAEALILKMKHFLLVPNANNWTSTSRLELLLLQKSLFESYL